MRKGRLGLYYATELRFPELRKVYEADHPPLPPYRGLAALWDDHTTAIMPDYPGYLAFLSRQNGTPLEAVLDIACGTGWLTSQLAAVAPTVVGVDCSPDMLAVANERYGQRPGVSFRAGDFKGFDIGRQFDAVVCASNSLNYVDGRASLSLVFVAVAHHLRPGGMFVFDTITEHGMRAISGLFFHAQVGERRFVLRSQFDTDRLVQNALVILPEGVEMHRRVPIGLADVRAASAGTGLTVVDTFSNTLAPWHPGPAGMAFFVLTKDVA